MNMSCSIRKILHQHIATLCLAVGYSMTLDCSDYYKRLANGLLIGVLFRFLKVEGSGTSICRPLW